MLDIGFWELALIGVVMLLVVGPERLPKVARTAGLWVGKARRTLSAVKSEIDREIKAEELKEILNKQAQSKPLETLLEPPSNERSSEHRSAGGRPSEETLKQRVPVEKPSEQEPDREKSATDEADSGPSTKPDRAPDGLGAKSD